MRRKAMSFLMPLFTVALGLLMISAVFSYLSYDENNGVTVPKLGVDQEAIFGAYAAEDSINAYAQTVASQALETAAILDSQDYETTAAAEFTRLMHQHPQVPLTARFNVEKLGEQYKFKSADPITVTIRAGELISGQSHVNWDGGFYNQWPMEDTPVTRTLTCSFGHRDGGSGTVNHAGLDIDGEPGDKVLSIAEGVVTARNDKRIVVQHAGGWTCRYIHVNPLPLQVNEPVSQGQQIATISGPNKGSHLDLRCYNHEDPLTYEQAEELFGEDKVRPHNLDDNKNPYAIDFYGNIYLDPYCLFTPELRAGLRYYEVCDGQMDTYRRQGTIEHKLLETCEAYQAKGLLASFEQTPLPQDEPSPLTGAAIRIENEEQLLQYIGRLPTEQETTARIDTTLENLENIITGENTNLELVNSISQEEGVTTALVIAMIAVESQGDPNAQSNTDVCGIMQATEATTNWLLEEYDGDHCETRNQIRTGVKYIKFLSGKYSSLPEPIAVMAAAYNGGQGNIDNAIEATRRDEPTMADIARALNVNEDRNKEIINHSIRYTHVYEALGGEDVQLASTLQGRTQAVGEYTFDIEATSTISEDYRTYLQQKEQLIQDLEAAPADSNRVEQVLRAQQGRLAGLEPCTTPADTLHYSTETCLEEFDGICGCPVEIVDGYDSLQYSRSQIVQTKDGESQPARAEWFGETDDIESIVVKTFDQIDVEESLEVTWSSTEENQIQIGTEEMDVNGEFYYQPFSTSGDQQGDTINQVFVVEDVQACFTGNFRSYCNANHRFDIVHRAE